MRKILIIIFLLVSVISAESFLGGYAEAENNADEKEQLAALSYELAHLHETSGEDKKAAEGYLQILANYPDDIPSFARAFSRLQLLCRKYSNRYKKSKSKKDPMEAYRAGKELDMFSASLKNVYDHYNMKGEYRKALHILNCLIRIEEKSMYYLDRGNIYLYGLNNPTKALDDFEKIMEIDPNHPTVYTDIGIANEFLGNYVKAKTAYNNAAKTSPQNHWVHYGLSRAKGMDLAADSQLVKDWYFMGHFDSSSKPGPIENQIIEELDIKKVYMSEDEEEFSWFRPFKENNFGFVNLSNIFMKKDFVRAYALTYVYSPKRRVVLFRIGCDDGAVLWVNENKLMDNLESQPPRVDDNIARGQLNEGWNSILLKIPQLWGGWGFYFRVTDEKGEIIDDLIFEPKQDNEKAKRLSEEAEKRRFYKMVKRIVVYSTSLLLILAVAIILSINIFNTIKTRKMREDFVSSITHDLKIPLAAIMGATEMLMEGKFNDAERTSRYYSIIDEEAKRLNVYVSKILEFSRNPRRKKRYLLEKRDIGSIVEKAINVYKKDGLADDLNISLETKKTLPPVALDEEAFVQVMVNLISNADKYSLKDKKIEITTDSLGDKVEVRVKDYGMGLKDEDSKLIFEDFFRSNRVVAQNIPGAGLGLTFVQRIVEAHKGTISVESVLDKGSVFIIRLPVI